jgi:hypothetical protein
MPDQPSGDHREPDNGLRRMLTWVLVALVLTVVVAIIAVELTLRWFGER